MLGSHFRQHAFPDECFSFTEGELEVSKSDQILGRMGAGKVFGELAILYNCTRTASVRGELYLLFWGHLCIYNMTLLFSIDTSPYLGSGSSRFPNDHDEVGSTEARDGDAVLARSAHLQESIRWSYQQDCGFARLGESRLPFCFGACDQSCHVFFRTTTLAVRSLFVKAKKATCSSLSAMERWGFSNLDSRWHFKQRCLVFRWKWCS